MKVFISSVRRGLEQERDAMRGLLLALGHEPLLFEDFSARSVPSREACLEGVSAADAYLLLLGPHYGDPLPETDRSPTAEEHVAALTKGMPRLVFVKDGVVFEPRQAEFRAEVEAYSTGVFRGRFTDAVDLQPAVAKALREVAAGPSPLAWSPLAQVVEPSWRKDWSAPQQRNTDGTILEVHAIPIPAQRLSARELRDLDDQLAARLRGLGVVGSSTAIESDADATAAWACPAQPGRQGMWNEARPEVLLGVRIDAMGQRSAWQKLPADGLGTLLDEADLSQRLARLLRLLGGLLPPGVPNYAVAVGLSPTSMVSIGPITALGHRNSASTGMSNRTGVFVPPDEAVTTSGLAAGADEVARALASALLAAFPRW